MSKRTGVVLAGGYARRFGDADKTLAELDGKPLISHAVAGLRPVVDDVTISCRAQQREDFERVLDDVAFCLDPAPDEGPLAGLAATLETVQAETVALAAADMPCVPADLYADFLGRLGTVDAVVVHDSGYVQPAPGVYRTGALRAAIERERENGDRRLRAVFGSLSVDHVDGKTVRDRWGADTLEDVNTRDALRELQQ